MEIVVQADINGVEVIALEQLAEVGVDMRNGEFLRGGLRTSFIDVRHGNEIHVAGHLAVLREMKLCDLPAADDADANGRCSCSIF